MVSMGKTLGVITETDGVISATNGGSWDYIGNIYDRTGGTDEEPVMTPKADATGNLLIHVNLRSPVNLMEAATALVAAHPELQAGLSDMGKFFVLDLAGEPARPTAPRRVFAGD